MCYFDGIGTDPTHLLTVLIADRRGIVAAITAVLSELHVELLELTQTVVCGYFTITLAVATPGDEARESALDQALVAGLRKALGPEAAVTLLPYRATKEVSAECDRYILTATGEASTAVIHALTELVAERGGNFVDFSFQNTAAGVSFVAEIDLPLTQALDQLQIDLRHVGAAAGLRVRLQHQRLFTATNEIAFRRVGS